MTADKLDSDLGPDSGAESNRDQALNPYSTPEAVLESFATVTIAFVKATRSQRLGAFVIDALICTAPLLVLWITGLISGSEPKSGTEIGPAVAIALGGFGVAILLAAAVLVLQLVMLYRNSWTVGKRVFGIKIVRANGEPAGLGRIVFLRTALPLVISMFPLCCIPVILAPLGYGRLLASGPSLLLLIDPLLILGREQRCGHDYVADTIVVKA